MEYRRVDAEELNRELFRDFRRHQKVTKCFRKVDGEWCIKDIAFIDDWNERDYEELIGHLREVLLAGGMMYGAFAEGKLKGFAAVVDGLFGADREYIDLTDIYVSEELRGRGVGTILFREAKDWARRHGAGKLYISAHSAVESQAFYKSQGCVEAEEYHAGHVEKEPCDCQMECVL